MGASTKARRMVVATVTVAVLVPAQALAGGEDIRAPGKVGIDHNARRDRFKGTVRAKEFEGYSEPGCRRLRQVVVKRKQRGPNNVVNRDLTNKHGFYSMPNLLIRKKFHTGRFYAQLVKKVLTSEEGPNVVCEKARSKVIRVR